MTTPGSGPSPRVMGGWVSLRDAIADAQRRLEAAGVPSPETDALLLAAHVMGVPRGRLMLHDRLESEQRTAYERLLTRRIVRVPLQHLLGVAPFRNLEVLVGPGVFIPRPETELVAQAAIDVLRSLPVEERRAVDLCTGSGAVALALAKPLPRLRSTAPVACHRPCPRWEVMWRSWRRMPARARERGARSRDWSLTSRW